MNALISALLCCLGLMFSAYARPKYNGLEVHFEWAIDRYAVDLAKRTGMEFLFVGDATNNTKAVYCVAFRRFHQEMLNEARIVSANLVEEFWQMLQESQEVKDYIKKVKPKMYEGYPDVVTLEKMGYKIGYWDKDINRPPSPFIAEILFEGGTFHYYEAEPETQKLKLVYKESYDEAIEYRNSQKNNSSQ